MNGRQAARKAAEIIKNQEWRLALDKADIIDYNKCILHMIKHGSPCDYCQDLEECKQAGKDVSIGCEEWMLRSQDVTKINVNGEEKADASERVHVTGS